MVGAPNGDQNVTVKCQANNQWDQSSLTGVTCIDSIKTNNYYCNIS